MRKLINYALVISIIFNLIFYNACNNRTIERDQANSIVDGWEMFSDSVLSIIPDTVKLPPDTIRLKGETVYLTRIIKEAPKTAKTYLDSIVNDSIDIRIKVQADNVYSFAYDYKPITTKIILHDIIYKSKPVPFRVPYEVKVQDNGLYVGAGLIFADRFAAKGSISYLTKKNALIGADFIRYGDANLYGLSYSVKLFR